MNARWIFAVIALALLSGCASTGRNLGFEVQGKTATQVMRSRTEPWQTVAVMGDLRLLEQVAVAVVNLPEPLPTAWKEELLDKGRTYTVKLPDGRKLRKPLERVVFRAAAYTADGRFVELFDAVINSQARALFVLLPTHRVEELKRYQLAILSSDASWLMTTQRKRVALDEGQDVNQLPPGFFEEHPSPLRQVIVVKRDHPVFQDLVATFPNHFTLRGFPYSGRPDADIILAQFTGLETAGDKIISCGSFAVSPGMMPLGVAISVARNLSAVSEKDCLNPAPRKVTTVQTVPERDL